MTIRFRQFCGLTLVAAVCCSLPSPAMAQVEFLKSLFGGRQQPQSRFNGYGPLAQATQQAQQGDIDKSLQSVREAFKAGGAKEPLNDPDVTLIAQNLVSLSKLWSEKNAPADKVAEVLRDIVLPSKPVGEVFPYPTQWQLSYDMLLLSRPNARLPAPESVAAELVRWAVLAKQTGELKQWLQRALESSPPKEDAKAEKPKVKNSDPTAVVTKLDVVIARVLAVQLAVAEQDDESANKTLKQLGDDAKQATGPMLDYLCHAVSAAVHEAKSEAAGLMLLEVVLDRAEQTLPAEAGLRMNAPWLRVHAAKVHAQAGRVEEAKRSALAAVAKPINASRFGADYATYLGHSLRQQAAAALLDVGLITDGLDLAGVTLTGSAARYSRGNESASIAAKTGRELRKLAPAARLELLRKWALPDGERTMVRSVVDFVPNDAEPRLGGGLLSDVYSTNWELVTTAQELGKLDDLIRELAAIAPQTASVSLLRTLAMVMRDGSANESNGTANPANSAKETAARLQTLVETTAAGVPKWETNPKPEPPLETYVVAVEAALHSEWRELADQLLRQLVLHSQIAQSARLRDHFRMALVEVLRLKGTGGPATPQLTGPLSQQRADGAMSAIHVDWLKLRPKLWDVIGFESAAERSLGALSPTWFTYEGYLSHVSSGRESDLVFAVPLAGTFELSGECREGGWSEGRIGYGGATSQIYAYQDAVYFHGKGQSGFESSPKMTNLLNKEPWNRHTIRVDGNSVRYFANGQLVFEDQPGSAAPWLTLTGTVGFTPSYRNLRISGSPTIPREVKLLDDARLRGWVATYFEESKSDALRTRKYIQVKITQNGQTYSQIVEDDGTMEGEPIELNQGPTDWMFVDGELRSARRNDFWGGESPSWLSYQRPLRDGETLRFEFFHAPGQTVAHPTFGEVVYAIGEEADVTQHKHDAPASGENSAANQPTSRNALASGSDGKKTGEKKSGGNKPDASAFRLMNHSLTRRACEATLKEGWNLAVMSLRDGTLAIELNGQKIASENITPTNSRRLGFYHDAARADLRVRNVVLTGDWPKTFDVAARAAIESPEPTGSLADKRFMAYALTETYLSDNAYEIARRAVKLDTPERYKFLHRWVMPNESSNLLRTSGAFTPTHPAPPVLGENPIDVATAEARQAVDHRLVQTGGNFVCPAILLVLAAIELDRLAELKQEVTAHSPASSLEMARNRAAMLGIIALLEDAPNEAIERIRECQTLLLQHKNAAMYSRWGDVALASLAIQHPVTRDAAFELLDFMQRTQLQAGNPGTSEFGRFVRQLHGQCVYLMHGGASEEFGSHPKTTQWRTVPQPRARTRGTGYPIASFDIVGGEMAERGGHDFDAAYFQSPLRGNYEVRCRLSHFDWREAMLMGAGVANALKYTHNEVKVSHVRNGIKELPIAEPITPKVQQWHDYKIVVKDGRYRSYVNGQLLYEEELPAEHDPWLAVVGWAGHSSRAVRDIVISGTPVIPKELDLLGSPDLRGWMADYFAAEVGQTPFVWKLAEGELTSPQTLDQSGRRSRLKIENIIRYHRPMLEDGEVSYEFFYDPDVQIAAPASDRLSYLGANAPKRTMRGQTLVHPALDRMVCLLEPDGVKIHWLTDGRWDRTGLTADNRGARFQRAAGDGHVENVPHELPLKPRDWNAVKFMTKGDALTMTLNDKLVFTRDIEPTNLRHFGLFHYANESNVRVRNIRYRGDWPKTLPSLEEQDLAGGPQKLAAIPDADLPDSMSWDFTKSQFQRDEFHFIWNAASEKHLTPTEAGLRFRQPAGEMKPQVVGISPAVRVIGDFIATMDYAGLKTVAGEEQWGSGLSFKAYLDGSYGSGFEVRHWPKSMNQVTRASIALYAAHRPHFFNDEAIPEFANAGRLRIQRHGPVLYYLLAEPGSDNFRLLTQRPLGTLDIKHVIVQADGSDKASGSEFTLKSLSIHAAKIVKGK